VIAARPALNGIVLAAALAACSPTGPADENAGPAATATPATPTLAPSAPPQPAPQQAPAGAPIPSPPGLAGEWRVAGIDGQPLDEPYGLALSGSETELWWAPRCAGAARRYRIAGFRISFEPAAEAGGAKPGVQPPLVCAIGQPGRLAEVMRALDSAETVVRTPANGIELSGGGHSLLLFSQ
jgi:hypothetical protein